MADGLRGLPGCVVGGWWASVKMAHRWLGRLGSGRGGVAHFHQQSFAREQLVLIVQEVLLPSIPKELPHSDTGHHFQPWPHLHMS